MLLRARVAVTGVPEVTLTLSVWCLPAGDPRSLLAPGGGPHASLGACSQTSGIWAPRSLPLLSFPVASPVSRSLQHTLCHVAERGRCPLAAEASNPLVSHALACRMGSISLLVRGFLSTPSVAAAAGFLGLAHNPDLCLAVVTG